MTRRAARGIVIGLLILGGCATPEARIRRDPERFASFPPEVQESVRKGRIEIGYTRDMVLVALGRPGRMHTRTTAAGTTEIWSYMQSEYDSRFEPVVRDSWYRDARGRLRPATEWAWADAGRWREYVALRVEFEGDKVKAIEAMQ